MEGKKERLKNPFIHPPSSFCVLLSPDFVLILYYLNSWSRLLKTSVSSPTRLISGLLNALPLYFASDQYEPF